MDAAPLFTVFPAIDLRAGKVVRLAQGDPQRQTTYGGSLVENITQAVARDLMAEAVMRCEQSGKWLPVLTVHDELIAEGPAGLDVKEFEHLMAATPPWADGCPVDAEGWSGFRYRK